MNNYLDILAAADKRDPGNTFVASCYRYLEKHGILSDKQMEALERVTRTKSHIHISGGVNFDELEQLEDMAMINGCQVDQDILQDYYYDIDGGNTQSWDWAGGE